MWWPLLWFALNLKYVLLVLIGALYVYWHWTRRHLYIASWKLDGPFSWPFIGNLLNVFKHRKCILNFAKELTENYKHPQRFWMGPFLSVYVAEPDDLQIVMNHPNALDKTFIYRFGNDYIGRSLLTVEGHIWRSRRKMIKPTFNIEVLEGYIEKFDGLSDLLAEQLKKTNEKEVNVFDYVAKCTIDMISQTAFDTELHAQTSAIGDEMIEATHNIFNTLLKRAVRLWLYIDDLFRQTDLYKSFMNSVSVFHTYTQKVFNRKLKEWQNKINECPEAFIHNSPKCFVDILIYNHLTFNNNNPLGNLTPDQIKREMDGMFGAGSDTTAHGISFILLLLAMFPEHQEEARHEALGLFKKIKDNGETRVERHYLHELTYLDRIINECLRLYPPTPLIARELTGPIKLKNGIILPQGTTIGIGIHSVQRDKKIWGEDADLFNPDRFSPENLKDIKNFSYSFIPFAAGERNCVGLKFARYSMKMMLMKILRDFVLETDEEFDKIECEVHVLAKKVNGWNVRFRKRK